MKLLMAELPTPPPSDRDYSAPSSPRRPLLPSSDSHSVNFDFDDFDFSRHLPPNPTLPAADELFHGGLIRPLHPHPSLPAPKPAPKPIHPQEQDPKPAPRPQYHHRVSKSLSPLRVSEFALHQSSSSSSSSSASSSSPSKRRIKDLLLFRSASEGRARATKIASDPLKKSSSVSAALFACIGSGFDNDSSFRYAIGEGEASSRRQVRYYRAGDHHDDEVKKSKTTSLQHKHRLLECMGLKSSSSSCCSSDHEELSRGLGHCFSL